MTMAPKSILRTNVIVSSEEVMLPSFYKSRIMYESLVKLFFYNALRIIGSKRLNGDKNIVALAECLPRYLMYRRSTLCALTCCMARQLARTLNLQNFSLGEQTH